MVAEVDGILCHLRFHAVEINAVQSQVRVHLRIRHEASQQHLLQFSGEQYPFSIDTI